MTMIDKTAFATAGTMIVFVLGVSLVHCGGRQAETATVRDTQPTETSDAATDAPAVVDSDEAAVDETRAPDDTSGECVALASTAAELFVDKTSSRASVGTKECPFHTILEATALGAPRTIHVHGATPALVYAEKDYLQLTAGMSLLGDGPDRTVIGGTGGCVGTSPTEVCFLVNETGGTLQGFTLRPSSTGPVRMTGLSIGDGGSTTSVSIARDLIVTGASVGIAAGGIGEVRLGPNIRVVKNSGTGVSASTAVHVVAASAAEASTNVFDDNVGAGIAVSSTLTFDGGSVSNNGGAGFSLGFCNGICVITNATATGNGKSGKTLADQSGVFVEYGASLKLRDSVLLGNVGAGLLVHKAINTIDLAAGAVVGGNTFGAVKTSERNGKAGICLEGTLSTAGLPANGNRWSSCPVVQLEATGGSCDSTFSYSDVVFAPTSASGPPIIACGCSAKE